MTTTRRAGDVSTRWNVSIPCPDCGQDKIFGYRMDNENGKHMHTHYVCAFWPSGAKHACGWHGWSVPGWREVKEADELQPERTAFEQELIDAMNTPVGTPAEQSALGLATERAVNRMSGDLPDDDRRLSRVEVTSSIGRPTHVLIEARGVTLVNGYIEQPSGAFLDRQNDAQAPAEQPNTTSDASPAVRRALEALPGSFGGAEGSESYACDVLTAALDADELGTEIDRHGRTVLPGDGDADYVCACGHRLGDYPRDPATSEFYSSPNRAWKIHRNAAIVAATLGAEQ